MRMQQKTIFTALAIVPALLLVPSVDSGAKRRSVPISSSSSPMISVMAIRDATTRAR